jgi:hypothetical protein
MPVVEKVFQFLHGAIKSGKNLKQVGVWNFYFNSYMVRLKVTLTIFFIAVPVHLMVRLKDVGSTTKKACISRHFFCKSIFFHYEKLSKSNNRILSELRQLDYPIH